MHHIICVSIIFIIYSSDIFHWPFLSDQFSANIYTKYSGILHISMFKFKVRMSILYVYFSLRFCGAKLKRVQSYCTWFLELYIHTYIRISAIWSYKSTWVVYIIIYWLFDGWNDDKINCYHTHTKKKKSKVLFVLPELTDWQSLKRFDVLPVLRRIGVYITR